MSSFQYFLLVFYFITLVHFFSIHPAQRVVVEQECNKAINADEIIKGFITQENVNNPLEFIKQICYQSTGNMPVYYYLSLANKSNDEGVSFIDEVPINSMSKDLLKRRINNREVKFGRLPNNTTSVTKKKKAYIQALIEHNLIIPSSDVELKYCLIAMRAMEPKQISEHKDYILNILYEIYSTYFNSQPFSSIKSEFRYTLCWIDEALYLDR